MTTWSRYNPPQNFIVRTPDYVEDEGLERDLFGDWGFRERCYLAPTADMFDLLVAGFVFTSKSQARKNWRQTGQEIPPGFSQYEIGQNRWPHYGKLLFQVWNPVDHAHTQPSA